MRPRKRLLQYLKLSRSKTRAHSSWLASSLVLLAFQNYFCKIFLKFTLWLNCSCIKESNYSSILHYVANESVINFCWQNNKNHKAILQLLVKGINLHILFNFCESTFASCGGLLYIFGSVVAQRSKQ